MSIQSWSDNIVVVDLQDDPAFSDDLIAITDQVNTDDSVDVVLNFDGVKYVNSSNLAKLLNLRKLLLARQRHCRPGKIRIELRIRIRKQEPLTRGLLRPDPGGMALARPVLRTNLILNDLDARIGGGMSGRGGMDRYTQGWDYTFGQAAIMARGGAAGGAFALGLGIIIEANAVEFYELAAIAGSLAGFGLTRTIVSPVPEYLGGGNSQKAPNVELAISPLITAGSILPALSVGLRG